MKLMAWSDDFLTGIDRVDEQHHHLVDLVNGAATLLAAPGSRSAEQVQPLMDEMAQYALTHFSDEEHLMEREGITVAHREHHHHSHASFAHEVARMQAQLRADGSISGTEVLRFLSSWLTFHILSEDMDMARQIRAIRAGLPVSDAPVEELAISGRAHAALNAALIDLFGLLTQRNASLTTVNHELQVTQQALAAANQTLEERVVTRTRELAAANAELALQNRKASDALRRLQQTQVQLMQSEKMAAVGQLAAGIAHEINTPIGFVGSNLNSLRTYLDRMFGLLQVCETQCAALPVDSGIRQALGVAQKEADLEYLRQDVPELLREAQAGLARVKRIVSDLRAFSHVDESLWQLTDLNHELECTLHVAWSEIKKKAQIVRLFAELPPVHCIASQINQVFMNLLLNAAHSIEDVGTITLLTGATAEWVWVEVQDTGVGMSAATQHRIFEPFFTTKPVGKGTGLGLSISWDIVKRHRGKLEVHSEVGVGSTFRMELPIQGRATS